MKSIVITGANGNLGRDLMDCIFRVTDYSVVAVVRSGKAENVLKKEYFPHYQERLTVFQTDAFLSTELIPQSVCGMVHLAFSRAFYGNDEIAASLNYSLQMFRKAISSGIQNNIYLSSQSVYGDMQEWRREDSVICPNSVYPMAKYAGEVLFESCFGGSTGNYAVLRLDYVVQGQKLVKVLCQNAKENKAISLRGGKQQFSYLDKRDVSRAILALLNTDKPWRKVYNVAVDRTRYSLLQVADIVVTVAREHGVEGVKVAFEQNETELWAGMDSSAFMEDTGWRPAYDLKRMVEGIYETL